MKHEYKLKPCPFCGGKAYAHPILTDQDLFITCEDCGANSTIMTSYPAAAEVWNMRHVPTCKMEIASSKEQSRYVSNWYVCSECKHPMDPGANYCSNCGAQVMRDE